MGMEVNGTFEVDDSSWESFNIFSGGIFAPSTYAKTSIVKHSGISSLELTWAAAQDTWVNHVPISGFVVGQQYRARVWVYTPEFANRPALYAFPGSGLVWTGMNDTWEQLTLDFVATTTSHRIGVRPLDSGFGGQKVYIDDFTVDLVSVTGSMAVTLPPMEFDQLINQGSGDMLLPAMQFTGTAETAAGGRQIYTSHGWRRLSRIKWPVA